ncbi:MAG: hypothetical protein OXC01_09635 [Immundisolibacterales bacterium]|nr:hypothetical protein [Immundisolibacterales bacterium]
MKTPKLTILAAIAPLAAFGGVDAAMADEMAAPEMRVWSTTLGEPDEEGMGASLEIVASASTMGSNGMIIESVSLIGTKTAEGEDGTMMTEVTSSIACGGPIMVEGGSFMIESAPMDEDKGEMAESDDDAAMETPCKFSVSGSAMHTYRSWHSWDLAGTVTLGEASMDFAIEDAAPAMIVEPEPEAEKAS